VKVIVMGAGIIGVSTAWYLLNAGHEVVVIDRQRDAALETSFANGAQISVSFCEPWANAEAPWKVLKWLLSDDAPLLFRPHWDVHQWRWALGFLGQCTTPAFERNVAQLVALGRYSHAALQALVAQTGIRYERLERGILHFFATPEALDAGANAARIMARRGVHREVLSSNRHCATTRHTWPVAFIPPVTNRAMPACSPKHWPACVRAAGPLFCTNATFWRWRRRATSSWPCVCATP
jgi:D-amino-acid dehydrogenase